MTTRLRTARAEMDASVQAREARAAGSAEAHTARRERRSEDAERTAASLPPAAGPESTRASSVAPPAQGTLGPPLAPAPPARIEATLALVERVETFLRSGRPGLAFTLGGTVARSVELERVGPRRVSVSLRGGVFGQAESRQLAAELAARGITLARLELNRDRQRPGVD